MALASTWLLLAVARGSQNDMADVQSRIAAKRASIAALREQTSRLRAEHATLLRGMGSSQAPPPPPPATVTTPPGLAPPGSASSSHSSDGAAGTVAFWSPKERAYLSVRPGSDGWLRCRADRDTPLSERAFELHVVEGNPLDGGYISIRSVGSGLPTWQSNW